MLRKVYVEITSRCNLQCGMCIRHVWQQTPEDMAPEVFRGLVEDLRRLATVEAIQFGGFGEPLVHPRFFDFLRWTVEAGIPAEVLTNGVLLDSRAAAAVVELGLQRLIVSLDGPGAGGNGTFHTSAAGVVQANLRELYRQRLLRRARRPEVVIAFVASRRTIGQLPALKRLGVHLGFSRILVTNLVPYTADLAEEILYHDWTTTRRGGQASPWNPAVELPRMDRRPEVQEVVDRLQASGSHVVMGDGDIAGGKMYCRFAHEGFVAIAPDGAVSPCLPLLHTHSYYYRGTRRQVLAYSVGNLRQQPLSEIWNSEAFRRFRARLIEFPFAPCIDCGGCDLRNSNQEDCHGNEFPVCGPCLWAAGLVQCP